MCSHGGECDFYRKFGVPADVQYFLTADLILPPDSRDFFIADLVLAPVRGLFLRPEIPSHGCVKVFNRRIFIPTDAGKNSTVFIEGFQLPFQGSHSISLPNPGALLLSK
ncbi:hypothetical protein DDZ16_18590 [Marinilabilia rubra]|uniref:Uncharacterized protein n=1 Tax=Marinilabilia rubra TaxID=2162893 RepID=A0A2U2B476_9BACT|nr:hypothetical protein DDZ16_18590 [Marinilabilia rubra]